MSHKITIKELASILGVSLSTVSKALNDSYEISSTTKKRVLTYAKRYSYVPNRIAANLKSGRTKSIGVILPSIQNFFHAEVLQGIENFATKFNYSIITRISNESSKSEVDSIQELINGRSIDGLIVAMSEETFIQKNYNHFTNSFLQSKPIVLIDRVSDSIKCDKVISDDFDAVYKVTKELIISNRKNIAIISTIDNLNVRQLRVSGYMQALLEYSDFGLSRYIIKAAIKTIDDDISKLLSINKIDAIVAIDEDATFATIKIMNEKSYQISNDISVVGYLNEKVANNLSPSLTTICQHGSKMGNAAAQILINRFESDTVTFKHEVIKSTIVKRTFFRNSISFKEPQVVT